MVDNEKLDNLVNARRKLKKFRDQQQSNGVIYSSSPSQSNTAGVSESNGIIPNNRHEPQTMLNGLYQNLSTSPIAALEEQNRQSNTGSGLSGRSSLTPLETNSIRSPEQKSRRDLEHFQEQLEIHVQTIGILVAEKTDLSAKLSQSFKQLERKQSEMDELHGRLKASRERVQELEKEMQNSTANVQKREMIAKESDKENDRLKIENIRQSQLIEDLKAKLSERANEQQQTIDRQSEQISQLMEKNKILENQRGDQREFSTMNNDHLVEQRDRLERENQLFQNAIEQWSQRYAEMREEKEHLTKLLAEKEDQPQPVISPSPAQESVNAVLSDTQAKERIEELEHLVLQLQSETETIGDYIRLYQEQRAEWQRRYQEKDDLIQQLTEDRDLFQRRYSEFQVLVSDSLKSNALSSSSSSPPLNDLRAFVEKNSYLCSTCTGAVQSV